MAEIDAQVAELQVVRAELARGGRAGSSRRLPRPDRDQLVV
jgi:hypothetical protein